MDSRTMVWSVSVVGWQGPHGPAGVFKSLARRCTTGDHAMPSSGDRIRRYEYQLAHLIEQEVLHDVTNHADGTEEAIAMTLVHYSLSEVRRAVTGLIQSRLVQRTAHGTLVVTSEGAKATLPLGWVEGERRKLKVKGRPIE